MRIVRIILIFLSLFVLSCSATNPNIRSITAGDVNAYLKQAPRAEEYPNAGADILYTYSYTEFFNDGTSVTRNIERIKIFNERGRHLASKTISYREGYQQAKIFFANTIKPNGQVIPVDKNAIRDSSLYAGYDFYTDIKQKSFTMPAVEDGCIIEYAYEIKNLKPVFPFDFFATFFCQNFYPMEEDIMEIVLPANIELKYKKFKTMLSPQIISDNNKRRYIFTNTKQKEIIPEARMPSLYDRNTFPQLSIWTMSRWDTISIWYIKLVQEQMKSDSELTNFTKQLITGKKNDEEKINEIFNFVSQKIRYVAVLLGPYTHKPHAAYEIFQKRYGDCKDKTILMLTMLKIAGIEGLPVLVPAYGESFDESIPSLNAFNHVIAVVPSGDKYFWLDATNETATYNSVPFFRPTNVFIINTDGSYKFIKTPDLDNTKDFSYTEIKYKIDKEGDADLDCTYTYSGKAAESIRYVYKYSPPEQRKKFFEGRGITVKELNLSNFTDAQEPFVIKLKGSMKNLAQKLNENLMVLSNIIQLDSYRDITAANERKYPIVVRSSYHSKENYSYVFPIGFKIKKLPPAFSLKKPFIQRSEKYFFQGTSLEVSIERKSFDHTVKLTDLDDFKKYALELQKHESLLKNIIMEKN
jgi:cellulose synthase operon protein C